MNKLLSITAAACLTAVTTGFASQTQNNSFQPHFFVEGNIGYVHTNNRDALFPQATMKNPNSSLAGGIDAGYVFMPHLGVEAGYLKALNNTTDGSDWKISNYGFYGALSLLTGNLFSHINLYVLAGLGYNHIHDTLYGLFSEPTSNHSLGFLGGIGANYKITDHITVGLKFLDLPGNPTVKTAVPQVVNNQYMLANVGVVF